MKEIISFYEFIELLDEDYLIKDYLRMLFKLTTHPGLTVRNESIAHWIDDDKTIERWLLAPIGWIERYRFESDIDWEFVKSYIELDCVELEKEKNSSLIYE